MRLASVSPEPGSKYNSGIGMADQLGRSKHARSADCRGLVDRLTRLLDAQRDELLDLRPYAEGRGLPTLRTSFPRSASCS